MDPGFAAFYDWTLKNNVPVIILSSGMEPIIRALLAKFIGSKAEGIPIVSNEVDISSDGSWQIIFRDESRNVPAVPVLRACVALAFVCSFVLPFFMSFLVNFAFVCSRVAIIPSVALCVNVAFVFSVDE